jgi:hypothetical protein
LRTQSPRWAALLGLPAAAGMLPFGWVADRPAEEDAWPS